MSASSKSRGLRRGCGCCDTGVATSLQGVGMDGVGQFSKGGSNVGAGGTWPLKIHLLPPDSKASWAFWRDFWGPKMLQKSKFSVCSAPDAAGGAYSAPSDPLADGEGARCPLPRTPPPFSALRASFLRVSGSNPLQSWQPQPVYPFDIFQMYACMNYEVPTFQFRRTEKMDSVMKGLMGQCPPP